MMICTALLSDIPSHLLFSNVETALLHAPSLARKYFTKGAELFCMDLGCSESSVLFFFFINLFTYLFIFGRTGSSLLHAGFLQLRQAGATLPCGARASHCGGFSCCKARALGVQASVVVAREL